jgi:uncharacterized protein (TIGR02466 family)
MSSDNIEDLQIESYQYFPTTIYSIHIPQFLDIAKEVAEEYLKLNDRELNEIYPVRMSQNFVHDSRLFEFNTFVNQTGWDILNSQGYHMSQFNTFLVELWAQQHYKHSLMEQHVHGNGAQLVGFYFLESPENSSRAVFHDPRPSKVIMNLPENDMMQVTSATNIINFDPKPGTMIISNSWLPHSFSRNSSDNPFTFIHFNIGFAPAIQTTDSSNAEII